MGIVEGDGSRKNEAARQRCIRAIGKDGIAVLSRVANSIYWMSRSIERAENYARFIQVNLNLSPDLPEEAVEQWEPLVETTGDQSLFKAQFSEATRDHVIYFLTADPKNPNSI